MAMQRARVSGREVAQAAGVSLNTVSLVVRDSPLVAPDTKLRVRAVIDRLGYRPHAAAAALASARSMAIGYLFQGLMLPNVDVFHQRLVGAIATRAQAAEYHVLLDPFIDASRCLALLASGRIDGVLLDWLVDDSVLAALLARSAPIVLVGRDAAELPLNSVKADEAQGAYLAARHLLDLGHRDFAIIGVSEEHASAIPRERIRGFQQALAEDGIAMPSSSIARGDWTFETGYTMGIALLRAQPRPTALFVLSEVVAAGALQAADACGLRVPDDLSLVTVEDSPWVDYLKPRLTAVHVPMDQVGTLATETLLTLLDTPPGAPRQIVLPTTFVVRESSGPAPR